MDRLEAFETMLADLQKQADSEKEQMEKTEGGRQGKIRHLPPVSRQQDESTARCWPCTRNTG